MKSLNFDNRDEWLFARRGKITGSRLKDLIVKRGDGKKIGFFEVIAERLSTDPEGLALNETPMERGTRLEPEAMARFEEDSKLEVDKSLVLWVREENEGIALSPDGFIGDKVAVECKCLSSARHIEAYIKKFIWKLSDVDSIPAEYYEQVVQYFVVNDKLKTLHMVYYDPRVVCKDYFYLTIKRKDVEEDAKKYLEYEIQTIKELDEIVNKISNF
jgi:hypothetical protein